MMSGGTYLVVEFVFIFCVILQSHTETENRRTKQKADVVDPSMIRSTEYTTAPAARRAACREPGESEVSQYCACLTFESGTCPITF